MKAKLADISALPLDRMELVPLPPGVLDVQIRLYCDAEAYKKLFEFFTQNDFENAEKYAPKPRALPPATPALPPVAVTKKKKA